MILRWALALLGLAPFTPSLEGEGPLNNDVFLPVSKLATEALARGDEAYAGRGEEGALDRPRIAAFEAWRSALTASDTGDSVTLPADAVDAERRTLGVEAAVTARLLAMTLDERRGWSERFGELAAAELANASSSPALLAGVERRNPGTVAAALACVRLADRELESGHPRFAAMWCKRAERHLELIGDAPQDVVLALAARASAAEELSRENDIFNDAWARGARLRFVERVELKPRSEQRSQPRTNRGNTQAPTGLTPGMAFLEDGRLALQINERMVIVEGTGRTIETSFEPAELLPIGARVPAAYPLPGDPRHWPLLPVSAGSNLLVVHGRATPSTEEPNALVCLSPPSAPPALGVSSSGLPTLNWARIGDLVVGQDDEITRDPLLAGLELAEFQPGPVIVGTRAFVQIRRYEGDIRAFLACIDLASGRLLWLRRLAQGSGLRGSGSRSGAPPRASVPGQPLTVVGDAVFVGTQLGAGVLVDVLDGRVSWSFENRRRETGADGWKTNWPPPVATGADGVPVLVWAPQDSDHLYWLRGRADTAGASPLLGSPAEIGESLALAGGSATEAVFLAGAGSRRVISSWNRHTGARSDSPFLGREENFAGACALAETRLLFASNRGLYFLDRERELFLLDYRPLPGGIGGGPIGGGVRARGARAFVLGQTALWTYLVYRE